MKKFLGCFLFILFSSKIIAANVVSIEGIADSNILASIESQLSNYKELSSDSISQTFKIEKDKKFIKKILKSFCYFDSEVTHTVVNNKIIFKIILNERYKFYDGIVVYKDKKNYRSGLTIGELSKLINIGLNSSTTTKKISQGSEKIKSYYEERGFAFVEIEKPKIKINRQKKHVKLFFNITLNKQVKINNINIKIVSKKDKNLLEKFVRNRLNWQKGDIYNLHQISDFQDEMSATSIFSTIEVTLGDPIENPSDEFVFCDININLQEAPLREIAAGGKYGSQEKLGGLFSWTHYNIDGRGSRFGTNIDWGEKTKIAKLRYSVFDIFYKKQEVASQFFYTKEEVAAYDVSKLGLESIIWQEFFKKCKVGLGVSLEKSRTKDKVDSADKMINFKGVGVPMGLKFDTTKNYLDPQSGFRFFSILTPYFANTSNLTVLIGKASMYFPISQNSFSKKSIVIACYTKYGSIFKKKNALIPRDKFFFSGGANSVRGYGYQKIGGVDKDKQPYGGDSVFEIGIEPRFRLNDNFGFVVFFEGGNVYNSKFPKIMRNLCYGYGAGVRYYTPIGPLRIDLAFPTKKRKTSDGKKIDSMFNLYISFGQAF